MDASGSCCCLYNWVGVKEPRDMPATSCDLSTSEALEQVAGICSCGWQQRNALRRSCAANHGMRLSQVRASLPRPNVPTLRIWFAGMGALFGMDTSRVQ